MENRQVKFPPPPRLLTTLRSGFDAVATHILVIIFPVAFDLFLWLGPHLRMRQLLQPLINAIPSLPSSALGASAADVAATQKAWIDFSNQFNLFSLLRTYPIGISSLMMPSLNTATPFGAPRYLDVSSVVALLGWWVLLVVLGWLLGGLYYRWVSEVSLKQPQQPLWKSLKQVIFLCVILTGLLLVIGLPALLLFSVLSFFSTTLGQIAIFLFALAALWLVMPVFFSPHGIFTLQQDAFHAILNSLRMVRFTLPNTGLFLMVFLFIGQGMNFLWHTPPAGSWLVLVGITGHAFISTALLAASFIYYRDINAWLKVIFEQLKTQTTSARV